MNFGYYKLFAVSPKLTIGKPLLNIKEHEKALSEIKKKNDQPAIVLFPELSISAYTCEDLFLSQQLLDETKASLKWFLMESVKYPFVITVGAPLEFNGRLYNCAVVISQGKILGIVPKTHIVNYGEFYEYRWFTSGENLNIDVNFLDQQVKVSPNQVFNCGDLSFGIEICEDLWAPISPSCNLALAGAKLILNLSASNELVAKAEYRKELIKNVSSRLNCGYLYVSAGMWESSRDLIFGGHIIYCENGSVIKESPRFNLETSILETEVDVQKIDFERRRNKTFGHSKNKEVTYVEIPKIVQTMAVTRTYPKHPFVPVGTEKLEDRVKEVLDLQAMGLARRLLSVPSPVAVLGLSGGSDSTLALLVCVKAMEKLNLPMTNIHAISMPGFGTSERTKGQAKKLAEALGVTFKEIDIKKTTQSHLNDIQHTTVDFVYENAQARERTQILFDYANKVNGIVIGTGSLSEIWANNMTYGADHLSSYNVNGSIPKTLTKFLIKYYPATGKMREVLDQVLATKISPELLPLDAQGNIQQASEEMVGPYELHDFFMYYFLRSGFSEAKLEFLASRSFSDVYTPAEVTKWLKESFRRFKIGQFKRTCSPPGIKVGSVTLNIREQRFPDDA